MKYLLDRFVILTLLLSLSAWSFAQDTATAEKEADKTEQKEEAEASKKETAEKEAKRETDKSEEEEADEEQETPKIQVRVLALSGVYVDQLQPGAIDPTSLLLGGVPVKQKSFYRLCEYLDELAEDDEIQSVVFDLSDDSLSMNSAQLDEFTRRMSQFKHAKKKTVAWLENASNVHLAIAACCDHVLMADMGSVDMPSAAMQSMFYKDAMDLVGVKASVVRAGDFKGAVEPYVNPVMSQHLREHYQEMLESINGAHVNRIAEGRGLTVAEVRQLQAKRLILPKEAAAKGLVDELAPYGSMNEAVEKHLGEEIEWITTKSKPRKQMSFFELMGKLMAGPPTKSGKTRDASIAVLHLSGMIVDGKKSSGGSIVSGPTVTAIEELAEDENVKGVVVRINSPGGSATASEAIRQALASLAKKKPTVISMGSMAASGGYWISCIGEPIYAEKATVTGSIGVFSMKLSFGSLMRRIGVHVESITLDDSAAIFAVDRTWNDGDVKNMQEFIDNFYSQFLKLVSKSRKMPVDKVEPLAGGRVWSGEQAKKLGLIDTIGGVDDCLDVIAKKAELDDYKVIHRPIRQSGLDLLELLGEGDEEEIFSGSLVRNVIQVLQSRGFHFETTVQLIRDSVQRGDGRPSVWALHPAELIVK